jgi:predicted lipoprotein with Yx(FWY)xxD motif
MTAPKTERERPAALWLAGIGVVSAGVAVALYIAGRVHTVNPSFSLFGRTYIAAAALKAVLATVALGVAILQVLLALWMYRKLPLAGRPPRPVRMAHRVVGFGLFALTIPIALHCLIAYGVQLTPLRVAVHSIAGCFFYGAFVAKVLLVQTRRLPGWVLPVAGGTLAVVVGVLWSSSALWYYNGFSPAPAPAGTLRTARIGGVTVLTNGRGFTLYSFGPDTAARSNCNGSCAAYWPPVTGHAAAGPGVTGRLGTIKRADGSTQATYNGHPLYAYIGDTAAGQAHGNNLNLNGGRWHEITVTAAK